MEDYPRTLMGLERRFAADEACREYLAQLRWPRGKLFYRLLEQAVAMDPVPSSSLT